MISLDGGCMDSAKQRAIREIIDSSLKSFINGFEARYEGEIDNPNGVINSKKNNCFIAELGEEFIFYSALVRSFDSSFGNTLEAIGNSVAKLSYDVKGSINSFLLPEQKQHIANIMNSYEAHHVLPSIEHYANHNVIVPPDITSFKMSHETDNYFYNPVKKEHYIIELKAGGDLDNKKSRSEKNAILEEYFLLKNALIDKPEHKVFLFFATAYNRFGEGNPWKQSSVKQYFAEEELLIGKNYWNFVCDDEHGFDIVFEQYKENAKNIKKALENIKSMYFGVV